MPMYGMPGKQGQPAPVSEVAQRAKAAMTKQPMPAKGMLPGGDLQPIGGKRPGNLQPIDNGRPVTNPLVPGRPGKPGTPPLVPGRLINGPMRGGRPGGFNPVVRPGKPDGFNPVVRPPRPKPGGPGQLMPGRPKFPGTTNPANYQDMIKRMASNRLAR